MLKACTFSFQGVFPGRPDARVLTNGSHWFHQGLRMGHFSMCTKTSLRVGSGTRIKRRIRRSYGSNKQTDSCSANSSHHDAKWLSGSVRLSTPSSISPNAVLTYSSHRRIDRSRPRTHRNRPRERRHRHRRRPTSRIPRRANGEISCGPSPGPAARRHQAARDHRRLRCSETDIRLHRCRREQRGPRCARGSRGRGG